MLLHRLEDPSIAAARLFRPLWDAGLRLGHSVRTVSEAGAAARQRFETQTTLLTARFVAGNRSLFDDLIDQVAAVTRARPLRRHLVDEERGRRRKWPYLEMAPDVKNGRGGLRTLQGLEWERRREALIGRFTAQATSDEIAARQTLLRARNALHAVSGRLNDVFSPELREPVARWLGETPTTITQEVIDAMHLVDRLAARHWPESLDEGAHRRPAGRHKARGVGSRRSSLLSRTVAILETGDRGALEGLLADGGLPALTSAWGTVRSRAQLEPFHQHPVGDHLWRSVAEMRSLIADQAHYGGVAAEVASPETLLLGAFLHDIGKGQGGDHSAVGASIAGEVCTDLGATQAFAGRVQRMVLHHLLLARTATRRDLDDPAVIDEVASLVGDLGSLQATYLLTVADSVATGVSMWSPWKATLVRTLFTRCAARFGADEPVETASHADQLVAESRGEMVVEVRPDAPLDRAVVSGMAGDGARSRVARVFAANGIDVVEARMSTLDDGTMVDSYRVRDDRSGDRVPEERWQRVRSQLVAMAEDDTALAARISSYPGPPEGVVPISAVAARDPATRAVVVTVKCSDRIGRLAEILTVLEELGLEVRLAKLESRGIEVVDTFHLEGSDVDEAEISRIGPRIEGMLTP